MAGEPASSACALYLVLYQGSCRAAEAAACMLRRPPRPMQWHSGFSAAAVAAAAAAAANAEEGEGA
eukprot:366450-Chlamydomonas_euryale.AAC.16